MTADQEILGVAAAFLCQQTASLIAPVVPSPVVPIPHSETRNVRTACHRHLRESSSPAAALAARRSISPAAPPERASSASLIGLGFG